MWFHKSKTVCRSKTLTQGLLIFAVASFDIFGADFVNFFLGPSHRLCHIRYDKDKNHSKFDFDKFEFCFIKSDEPSQWRRPSINKRTANYRTTGSYDSKRTNLNEKYAKRTYTGRIGKFSKTFMVSWLMVLVRIPNLTHIFSFRREKIRRYQSHTRAKNVNSLIGRDKNSKNI